ncbi:MAG: hypothetical protein FWG74_00440, partial [Planctomycetes bacterium]|nr:hypothetical protein [Planctomycetota bacterium]
MGKVFKFIGNTALLLLLFLFAAIGPAAGQKPPPIEFPIPGTELDNPQDHFNNPDLPSTPNSLFPRSPASENEVNVRSGSIGGHVFGGIGSVSGEIAKENVVNIYGGTIGSSTSGTGNVTGGWSFNSSVIDNEVFLNPDEAANASVTVRGIIFGAWKRGGAGGEVSGNIVRMESGVSARDNIYGGYSQGNSGKIYENQVYIHGGEVRKTDAIIAGAYSAIGVNEVYNNLVKITAGTINNARIYGGRAQSSSNIYDNEVIIAGGTILKGAIYGGENIGGSGLVARNKISIEANEEPGGVPLSVNATIYGGYSSGGGNVEHNTINIIGGTVRGDIFGGYSSRGSATNNIVTIGGLATLEGAALGAGANIYGGSVGGTGNAFSGNTLNLDELTHVMIDTVQNFQTVNFGVGGVANIGILYTAAPGSTQPGVTVNTNAYTVTFNGTIKGSGDLIKIGENGTLILAGDDSEIDGRVQVEKGTLQLGAGGAMGRLFAGTGKGFILGDGTVLAYNLSGNDITEDQQITGQGAVVQMGPGTLHLAGGTNNRFTGGTEIQGGTLLITDSNSYNKATSLTSKAGYITFTGSEAGIVEIADVKQLTNSFRTNAAAGENNRVDLSSTLTISGVNISQPGGAFYVETGTVMNVYSEDLLLTNNRAGGILNDLFVASGGEFNLTVNDGGTASFQSGIGGQGTLNLYAQSDPDDESLLESLVQFWRDSVNKQTFQMGITNVRGSAANTIVLDLAREKGADRVKFTNTAEFNIIGNDAAGGLPAPGAILRGDGIVKVSGDPNGTITVSNGAVLMPAVWDGEEETFLPATLTLEAPTIELDNFELVYLVAGDQKALIPGEADGIPTSNNSLLYLKGSDGDFKLLNDGNKISIETLGGDTFHTGDYLIIKSDSAITFDDGKNLNSSLSAYLNGIEINMAATAPEHMPRGHYLFALGDDNSKDNSGFNVWLTHHLNSLSMDWTKQEGTDPGRFIDWTDPDAFMSLQKQDGIGEEAFLTGDKVYISGDEIFNIKVDQNIGVSGLVVGYSAEEDANDAPFSYSSGRYTISGTGGITAYKEYAFGDFVCRLPDNTCDSPELKPTGKLEKYGASTLTFKNEGNNWFNEGIHLYGGEVQFTHGGQLGDGGKGVNFYGNSRLQALKVFDPDDPEEDVLSLTNFFRAHRDKENNIIDLGNFRYQSIGGVRIYDEDSGEFKEGDAFHVESGATMDVYSSNQPYIYGALILYNNLHDLFVESDGVFNYHGGFWTSFLSGIDGKGKLNLYANTEDMGYYDPGSVVEFRRGLFGENQAFNMGTTNVIGSFNSGKTIFLNLTREDGASRVEFINRKEFSIVGNSDNGNVHLGAYLMGDGIVKADETITVSNWAVLMPASFGDPSLSHTTLTLDAPNIYLEDFVLAYWANDPQRPLNTGTDKIPTSNNSLLYLIGDQVTLENGLVFIGTANGFAPYDYLIIKSTDGFFNIRNDEDLQSNLTAWVDGFDLDGVEPRGKFSFHLGGDPDASGRITNKGHGDNVWFTHELNSLSMDWTGVASNNWADSNFVSYQGDGLERAYKFLTGDKVYISGTTDFDIDVTVFNPLNPESPNIMVSGLVVGKNAGIDGVVDTSDNTYTIYGSGGITADMKSAFGEYVNSGEDDELIPTGMLQKYG